MDQTLLSQFVGLIAQISLGSAVLVVHAACAEPLGRLRTPWRQIVTGVAFGAAGALALTLHLRVAPAVIVSIATATVALAALFGGWRGAAAAFLLVLAARWALGLPHVPVGALRDLLAALAGLGVGRWFGLWGERLALRHLVVLGLLAAAVWMVGTLASPEDVAALGTVSLALIVVLPLGTVLLGMQYLAEQRREELVRRLAESEHRLRGIVENLPGAVFEMRLEPDGSPRYTFYHDASLEPALSGTRGPGDPARLARRLLPEEEELRERYLRETGASLKPAAIEYRARRADGSVAWLRTRASPRLDTEGRIVWTGITSDITAEKRKDDELRRFAAALGESERRFRSVMDSLPAMVYEARESAQGGYRFTYVSEGARMLGLAPQQLIADASLLERMLLPEDEPQRQRILRQARERLGVHEREMRMRLSDGTIRWMHNRAVPRRAPGGDTIWDGILFDVTEHHELQDAYARSGHGLVLDELAGGAARAFQVLLESAVAAARELEASLADRADLLARLRAIQALAGRGAELEARLARFLAPAAPPQGAANLRALLEDARALAEGFLDGTRLALRAAPALWPPVADPVRVQSAVLALVLYARDCVGRRGEITVTARNVLLDDAEAQAMDRVPGAYLRVVVAGNHAGPAQETVPPSAHGGSPGTTLEEDPRLRAVRAFTRQNGGYLTSGPGYPGAVELLLPAQPPDGANAPPALEGVS